MAGRVVGIIGRMGSGKSYMAVRLAYKRLRKGADVCTNFTMKIPEGGAAGRWRHFSGWEQFAELENAVVIVDEAHLYASSSHSLQFPMVARWKLSQARKFGLDVYWISQHEDRVNRTLRDLTNLIYVCNAWFDHLAFTAKGYEPEYIRKKNRHVDRKFYFFSPKVAALYDTLEILDVDEHLADGMGQARSIRTRYNARRNKAADATEERSSASTAASRPPVQAAARIHQGEIT